MDTMQRTASSSFHRHYATTFSYAFIAFALTVLAGCKDSRLDVYEFIELQEEADEYENGGTEENGSFVSAAGKTSHRRATAKAKSAGGRAHRTVAPTPSAPKPPAGPVTYVGKWVFNKSTGMWSYEQVRKNGQPVILASHQRPPDDSAPETSGETTEASEDRSSEESESAALAPFESESADDLDRDNVLKEIYAQFHRPYRIGAGDVLRVSLTGLTGIEMLMEPTEVLARVNRRGEITLPMVGPVKVVDREIEDVEQAIYEAYVPKFVSSLGLSVEVHEYKSTDVVVVGAALLPGLIKLNREQRDVLHAVVLAGGMSDLASGQIVLQRVRSPREKLELNIRNTHHLKTAMALEPLESGDVVTVVAAQPNTVFVGGLVTTPGPKEFPPGTRINALQALAAGGGVIENLFPSEATLIRRMPTGEDLFVRLDLNKTRCGEDPNVVLAAGDILWVPETHGTRIMDFVNRTFFLRAGMTVTYNVTGIEFLNRHNLQGRQTSGGGTIQNSVDPLGFLAN
ncbi:MAG TPA: polysaccharide biosynthesis/export family protein [Phycisphaerae bacterium]|nr:polysaccharide biosynthesis/export family protein [Phycisphaerae bacterium]